MKGMRHGNSRKAHEDGEVRDEAKNFQIHQASGEMIAIDESSTERLRIPQSRREQTFIHTFQQHWLFQSGNQ